MFLVGLSGGIASGKSTVVAVLRELGCAVIDADVIARQGEFSRAGPAPRGSPDNRDRCREALTAEGALGTSEKGFPATSQSAGLRSSCPGGDWKQDIFLIKKKREDHDLINTVGRLCSEFPSRGMCCFPALKAISGQK